MYERTSRKGLAGVMNDNVSVGFLRWKKLRILLALVCILLFLMAYSDRLRKPTEHQTTKPESDEINAETFSAHTARRKNIKTILFWNDFFNIPHFGLLKGDASFVEHNCRVTNCAVWDRDEEDTDLPEDLYDAVVFHGIPTSDATTEDLPVKRGPRQRYVFLLSEAPAMHHNIYDFDDFFNWTFTYRRDSDIYSPYGRVKRNSDGAFNGYVNSTWLEPIYENITLPKSVRHKTKIAAWLTSNPFTSNRRSEIVEQLSRYVSVDIYGKNHLKCEGEECYTMMDDTYKFYLSFENSLCKDYVTEKFFRALRLNMVPIVYGGADYKEIAPPMSYIDVADFSNPRYLGNHLGYIDEHPEEYKKYFWWKRFYTVEEGSSGADSPWCTLCEKLNDEREPVKWYPSIRSWWFYPGVCHSVESHFSPSERL